MSDLSRREVLRRLALTIVAAGAVDRVSAQEVHQMASMTSAATGGTYAPTALSTHEYQTLERLTDFIIPVENGAPGAVAAGVAAFIDMLAGVNGRLEQTLHRRYGVDRWRDKIARQTISSATRAADRAARSHHLPLQSVPELAGASRSCAGAPRVIDGFCARSVASAISTEPRAPASPCLHVDGFAPEEAGARLSRRGHGWPRSSRLPPVPSCSPAGHACLDDAGALSP